MAVKFTWQLTAWTIVLAILFWLSFFRAGEAGLTSWELFQDWLEEDDWIGWVHPFGDDVAQAVELGPFDNLEDCREQAFSHLEQQYSDWDSAVYHCGYRCATTDFREGNSACRVVTK